MRTQRRKRTIAKTPRKKGGEQLEVLLGLQPVPAEDGHILLSGLYVPLPQAWQWGGRACLLSWV